MIKIKNALSALVFLASFATAAFADVVKSDNIIVKGYDAGVFYPDPNTRPDYKLESWGNFCIGMDCINGEDFGLVAQIPTTGWLRLKENNLRIRLHDVTGTLSADKTWYVGANDSANGGDSYLSLATKSLSKSLTVLGDGVTSYPWVSESDPNCPNCSNPPSHVTCVASYCTYIPAQGATILAVSVTDLGVTEYSNLKDYEKHQFAYFSSNAVNAVAIGYDSEVVTDKISLGRADMLRRLAHVANGLKETDLIVKSQLDNFQTYPAQQDLLSGLQQQIATLNTTLLSLEQQLDAAETKASNPGSDNKNIIERLAGTTGLSLLFSLLLLLLVRQVYRPVFFKIK
ncbi:MAG: hypothetical protein HRU23_10035 [Gammaproteobacteria bacterium]|nr:hypothetical protein [Gammaproteobacteria bacterium]